MSAPLLTWNFEAKSGVTGVSLRTDLSEPVDAKLDDLIKFLNSMGYEDVRLVSKEWERWAWPGGYPLYYLCEDGGVLCSKCVNKEIELTASTDGSDPWWKLVAVDVNYEDPRLECEHCGEFCESAYAESDNEGPEPSDAEALASAGRGTDEDYGSAEDML